MSSLRNKVQLIGHLGTDPVIKIVANDMKIANISIATTERYMSNGEWKDDTQWHRLVMWSKLAERAELILKKGSFVMIEGKLEHRSYVDVKGETKYITEVRVSNFILLDRKTSANADPVVNEQTGEVEEGPLSMEDDGLPF